MSMRPDENVKSPSSPSKRGLGGRSLDKTESIISLGINNTKSGKPIANALYI